MKITLIVLGLLIVAVFLFLWYMGMFSRVEVREARMGPYTFAYVEHVGPYASVAEPMMKLDTEMREAGFVSTDGIGLYFDDPRITPAEELRSEIGSIITPEDMGRIEENRDRFQFKTLEAKEYVIAESPIRNLLSYMLGPRKVYPALEAYMYEHGLTVHPVGIEIYDMRENKILFLMEAKR